MPTPKTEDAQEVYCRIQENKKILKDRKEFLTEQYMKNEEYKKLVEEAKKTNSKKKIIRWDIDKENPRIVEDIEDLKIDIAADKEKLNDIFTSALAGGEMLEIENQYQQLVIPIFSVSLRRKDV